MQACRTEMALLGEQSLLEPIDIVLHAGAHKTATTHLQQLFYQYADKIQSRGTSFVGPRHLRRAGQSLKAALGAAPGQDRDAVLSQRLGDARGLLVSEENALGMIIAPDGQLAHKRLYPTAPHRLTTLAKGLKPHRLHLAVGLRNPADLLVSAYAQALMAGNYRSWEDFIGDVDPVAMEWSGILERLAQSGHFASIVVWRYEDYHAVFHDVVAHLLGPDHPIGPVNLNRKSHEGLSGAAVDACARWYADGHRGRLGTVAREDFPISDSTPRFSPWSDTVQDTVAQGYADDMARLETIPGITVLKPTR